MSRIDSFGFHSGRLLINKYEVISLLGKGWEGEVCKVKELATGIERAAKFFFPQRDPKNTRIAWYAKKLHKLRHCDILIQYMTQENLIWRKRQVPFLVSEFVEGMLLSEFLKGRPGKKLTPFEALHLLHRLTIGLQSIHRAREYHGDLHSDNVIVQKFGLGFELKILDLYHWQHPRSENIQDDICDVIKVFYEALGGVKTYNKLPDEIKYICCGKRKNLIKQRFKTTGELRAHIESLSLI